MSVMTSQTIIQRLAERKIALDAKIVEEKEAAGGVTLETALAWWDVATALRDIREHQELPHAKT